jgi:4-hydroxy-3-polyprenylbenzoate decarboxylase
LTKKTKFILAITGASGVHLGLKLASFLPTEYDIYLVMSDSAKIALELENNNNTKTPLNSSNITILNDSDISSCIASGSFGADMMAIIPCSMNTLAKISVGISDTLITRAFSVMLKENRKILIAPREMPFSQISLENMLKLSKMGVIIAPPVNAYYSNQNTLEDMEKFFIGKWFDLLGIENELFTRWGKQ